jgi:hypothetical protein
MRVRLARSLSPVNLPVESYANIRKFVLRARFDWFVAGIVCGASGCSLLLQAFAILHHGQFLAVSIVFFLGALLEFALALFAFARIFWKPRRCIHISYRRSRR